MEKQIKRRIAKLIIETFRAFDCSMEECLLILIELIKSNPSVYKNK